MGPVALTDGRADHAFALLSPRPLPADNRKTLDVARSNVSTRSGNWRAGNRAAVHVLGAQGALESMQMSGKCSASSWSSANAGS